MSQLSTGASDEEKRLKRLAVASADPDAVMSFADWCFRNGFSEATGYRVIKRGEVAVTQLSPKRIGITFGADKSWKDSKRRVVPA
jgi:hypothetical protein